MVNESANKDDKPVLLNDARQRLIDDVDRIRTRKEQVSPAWFETHIHGRMPWMRSEDHAHMIEGLRKAGWREE